MRVESKFGNYFEVQIVQCTGIASLVSACTNTWAFFHRRFLCLHTWSSNLPVQVKYRSQYTRKVQSRLSFIPKQKAVLNLERGNHSQPDGHFKISLASLPVVVSSRLYYQHKAAVVPLTALHCSTTTSQVQKEPPGACVRRLTLHST